MAVEVPETLSAAGVKRVLLQHVRAAADALQGPRRPSDAAVHDARRRLKRARACLRMLRDSVGEESYRRENVALRDVARQLSTVRDAAVMERTFAEILRETPAAQPLAPLRQQLLDRAREVRRYGLHRSGIARSMEVLQGAGARIEAWEVVAQAAPEPLHAALERLYRKGRKALVHAAKDGSPDALHEARKQVKYLELALEPFQQQRRESDPKGSIAGVVRRARAIEEDLGKDHDLVVLRIQVSSFLGAREAEGKPLYAAIEAQSERLRAQAMKQARKLYRKKPARFVKRTRKRLEVDAAGRLALA